MISTSQFLEMSPGAQREVLLDGILYAKIQSRQFAIEIDKLNGWLRTLDVIDVDPEFIKRFLTVSKELSENIDMLTSRIVDNGKRISETNETLQSKILTHRLTKPTQS